MLRVGTLMAHGLHDVLPPDLVGEMQSQEPLRGAGGIGDVAISYGYQRFDWILTLITVAVIVVLVQSVQFFGNWLARKVMRR